MTSIAVCVVSYNTRALLRGCLSSVQDEQPAELVVVDNASTDGSAAMVRREFPAATLVSSDENLGYGAAANRAIARCRSEYVLLLNADTRLTPGSLDGLTRYLAANERAAVVGPRIANPDGTKQVSCFPFPTPVHLFLYLSSLYRFLDHVPLGQMRRAQPARAQSAKIVPWVLGAAMAVRRTAFASARGFDEAFFMYFEEVDLCYRLARAGWEIHFAPVADVIHVGGASTRQQRVDMALQYFASLTRFYRKHYSRLRMGGLLVVVQCCALLRLAHACLLMHCTRDEAARTSLCTDVAIYRRLLLTRWCRAAS